ncbi:MAG: Na+/H+-dicarboxylate symporter, partial [uncultured Gemmatimonadaceae bacterium]
PHPPPPHAPPLPQPHLPGALRHHAGRRRGGRGPRRGARGQAHRRHLREPGPHGDRADHLPHDRARHREHAGHQAGGEGGRQGVPLLRGRHHLRARHRAGGGERHAARRGVRRVGARRRRRVALHGGRARAPLRRLRDARGAVERGGGVRRGGRAAGGVLRPALRRRAHRPRRADAAPRRRVRAARAGVLPHHRHRDAGGADRRVRGDGVHHRQLRAAVAAAARAADARRLRHDVPVRVRRAQRHRAARRVLALALPQVHPRGDPHRARHLELGGRAAAHARQAGALRVRAVGGGARGAGRLLVQPRRHLDLPVDGHAVHRAGVRHRPLAGPAALGAGGAHAHLQGGGGRHRLGVHRAREHALGDARGARGGGGARPRRRPLHERGAGDREPDRQRRGHGGDRQERGGVRRGDAAGGRGAV